jgi:hypothetical protein
VTAPVKPGPTPAATAPTKPSTAAIVTPGTASPVPARPARPPTTTGELARQIFAALQANDRKAFDALYPNDEESTRTFGTNAPSFRKGVEESRNWDWWIRLDHVTIGRGKLVALEVKDAPSHRNFGGVYDVDELKNASIVYEVDGARKVIPLKLALKIGEVWRLVRLRPKKTS